MVEAKLIERFSDETEVSADGPTRPGKSNVGWPPTRLYRSRHGESGRRYSRPCPLIKHKRPRSFDPNCGSGFAPLSRSAGPPQTDSPRCSAQVVSPVANCCSEHLQQQARKKWAAAGRSLAGQQPDGVANHDRGNEAKLPESVGGFLQLCDGRGREAQQNGIRQEGSGYGRKASTKSLAAHGSRMASRPRG